MLELLTYYLIGINFAAFAAFGIDKSLAESGQWRISEATLVSLAMFGGLPGALAGRAAFRHKTRKKSFADKLFVAGVVQVVVIGLVAFSPASLLFESDEAKAERLMTERSIYYSGCREVRAAGKAPLYRGEPGYREGMDGDGDGVACEPYF